MADEWVKLRAGIESFPQVAKVASVMNTGPGHVVYLLYRSAAWASQQGHYGKLPISGSILDFYLSSPGYFSALESVGWAREENGYLLFEGFTDVSRTRKALGANIRKAVLDGACCEACGATDDLQVDHIVPISRGGRCDLDNLQALCRACNIAKGTKTMDEFMAARKS